MDTEKQPDDKIVQKALHSIYAGDAAALLVCLLGDKNLICWRDPKGNSLLHHAAWRGDSNIITTFGNAADADQAANLLAATNKEGDIPLHMAAKSNQDGALEAVRTLIQAAGENWEKYARTLNNSGETPQQLALRQGNKEIAAYLSDPEAYEAKLKAKKETKQPWEKEYDQMATEGREARRRIIEERQEKRWEEITRY